MSITQYSLRNRSVVWFVVVLFLLGGIWAFMDMGKKEDSTFVLKSAVVTCPYSGATPFQVEQLISEPIARELQSMRNIKKITSESYYGVSRIVVELQAGTPPKQIPQMWDELRRKAANVASQLPEGAGPIVVNDDFGDVYGLYYGLVADDGFAWSEMREWAQKLKTDILTIDGVEKVALYGEQQPVVNIYLTRSVLANFAVTPEMILKVMQQQNVVVNSGEVSGGEIAVRVLEMGAYNSVTDIENQLLIAADGRQFRLGDVARVERSYVEPPQTLMMVNNQRAIGIGVSTSDDEDVVAVGQKVNDCIEHFAESLPAGMEVVSIYPEDKIAEQANYSFALNILESVAIVMLIIMLAMGLRSGVVIGSSLILTIGGTMLVMYMMGEGINRTSLAGFVIAMGMLVDNAIVVVDNTLKSAQDGTRIDVGIVRGADGPKWSLLGATFIAILSFLPLYTAPSSVAEIIRPLFIVISVSLIISWVLALTQVPLFGVELLKPKRYVSRGGARWFRGVVWFMLRHRGAVVSIVVLIFVLSLHVMRGLPQNFFPQLEKNYFRADVLLPEGYDLSATSGNLAKMTSWLQRQKEVAKVTTTAGSTPLRYYLASGSYAPKSNYGNILIELHDKRSSAMMKERFERFVADSCPDVWLRASLFKLSPVPEAAIEIGFVGPDIDTLLHLTHQVKEIMWANADATNVRNSWGNRVATWMPHYSQIKGQRIGVARSDMAQWMRFATQGYPMAQMRQGDEVIPIVLKDDDVGGFNLSNLQSIPLFSASGKVYSLEQATADFEFDYQFGAVKKVNRRRVMKAQCDPVPGVNTMKLYGELMQRVSQEVEIPQGYTLEIFGEQESMDESNDALLSQVPLALILIFIILLLLFGNYRDPIAILLMTPLIFIGVVLGLAVMGKNFDFFALLGIIGLVGMNIKNAVILLSSIREMRRGGVEASEAVVNAAAERLLPVCLASFTTILALIPLLFDSLFGGMAASIMGGLLVATILTVLVLPVVYSLLYNIKVKK